jgi:hypothetical protein
VKAASMKMPILSMPILSKIACVLNLNSDWFKGFRKPRVQSYVKGSKKR